MVLRFLNRVTEGGRNGPMPRCFLASQDEAAPVNVRWSTGEHAINAGEVTSKDT